eukprot:gene108-155_t
MNHLKYIQNKINSDPSGKPDGYENNCEQDRCAYREYLDRVWENYIGDQPILVYSYCMDWTSLGNTIGHYLNQAACAHLAGLHFIAVEIKWIHQHNSINTKNYDFLPDIIIHTNPITFVNNSRQSVITHCSGNLFPWESITSSWTRDIKYIGNIMQEGLVSYIQALNRSAHIPDITIQYRCSDNIVKNWYGLLPFTAFKNILAYNSNRLHIYILSDPPDRHVKHKLAPHCNAILHALKLYLQAIYPNSKVSIRRGGNPLLHMAYIALAKTTVCSASTFCLWPAISRNQTTFYPFSQLVASGKGTQIVFESHFQWIMQPAIISSFPERNGSYNTDSVVNLLYTSQA